MGLGMYAFGCKADKIQGVAECPLIANSGHWWANKNGGSGEPDRTPHLHNRERPRERDWYSIRLAVYSEAPSAGRKTMTTPKTKLAGDRDSDCLLPHGFHPIFGLMLSGMLDQHNPARSDGRHRENFFRRLQKKRKTGPAREPVRQPCLFADAESGHWGTKVCFLADSGSPRGHR